jgi:hypothetical protein
MAQRFRIDRPGALPYLVVIVALLAGCRSAPGPLVPVAATPVSPEKVAEWVRPTVPAEPRLLRFKWLFRDERSSAGGRGSARIAPPDSLRFDVAGPFGSGASAAAVVGDSALWAEPPDAIKKLVPNYPLLWALIGVARMPEPGSELRGLEHTGTTAWQYVRGADTLEYSRTGTAPVRFQAEVRQAGKVIGRAETELGPDGMPRSSRLTVPSVPARLDLTFTSTSKAKAFAESTWLPPEQHSEQP